MKITAFAWIALLLASAASAAPPPWSEIHSFTYQLQKADLTAIGMTRFNAAVLDYSSDGSEPNRFTRAQIAALQNSPTGPKRVLAYMSVGEAEDYRFYWQTTWDANHDGKPDRAAPAWLGPMNPEWKGNYKVKYWDPAWQAIVFRYVDKVIDAGFDGVYLDVIDAFEYWGPDGESNLNRAAAPREMADFVIAIARYARVTKGVPNFAVFVQNGEVLGQYDDYLNAITGIGREDVYYNGNKPNKKSETAEVTRDLDVFKRAGKPVLIIDYVTKKNLIDDFYKRATARGYIPYATVRPLDALTINPGHEP